MRSKITVLVFGVFVANVAYGEIPITCPESFAGKTSCIEGGMMQCAKEFDPKLKEFKYVWHGINNSGQPFDVTTPLYKKVPGMTPASCGGTAHDSAQRHIFHSEN